MVRDTNIVRDAPDATPLDDRPEARDLVLSLVRRDARRRPTAPQALARPPPPSLLLPLPMSLLYTPSVDMSLLYTPSVDNS